MRRTIFAAVWMLWFVAARPVAAQAFLEQLEQLVRKQVASAADPASVPPPPNPAPKPAAASQGSAETASAQERGYLGIVTDDRQDRGRGVRILEVRPDGPGEKAGLRAQDLITGLGGVRVRAMRDLAPILEQVPPGGTLAFDLLRDQQAIKLEVTFGRRPASATLPEPPPPHPPGEKLVGPALDAPSLPKLVPPPVGAPPALEMPTVPAAPAPAAESPQTDRDRIEALERRVKQLEQRLEQLERAKPRKD